MTFASIQSEIAERLNLTSTTALARIGRSINEAYRKLASTIGIQTIERQNGISASTVIGNRQVTFTAEKLLVVYNPAYTPIMILDEVSEDTLRNDLVATDPPTEYAVVLEGASTVTIELNVSPATIYTLKADAMVNLATLSGTQVPAFAEDYHDILIHMGMEIEYLKMEKPALAKYEHDYVWGDEAGKTGGRIGEYRLYIASSAYKEIVQGAMDPRNRINSVPLI